MYLQTMEKLGLLKSIKMGLEKYYINNTPVACMQRRYRGLHVFYIKILINAQLLATEQFWYKSSYKR